METILRFIPKERADKFGVLTSLVLLTFVTINDLITLHQKSFENGVYSLIMLIIGLFILYNVLGNMIQAIRVDTTICSIKVQIKQLPEWKYCSICEQYAPARAFHCFTCNKCILKRHNHCLFLGKCVGHNNLRFYLLFIFYVWLGNVYSCFINIEYFLNSFDNFSFKSIIITFIPWFAWLIGLVSLKEFYFIFTNASTFILLFLLFFYFLINFKMALNGQTWYENSKNIRLKKNNWRLNLIEIFGNNWFKALLNPFVKSQLTHDGTLYSTENTSTFTNQILKNI